ncbi:MAG TPA: hypothetical protein VF519_01620 [Mycobacteriales bacterium]|jgi:hypothetical protein
MRRLLLAAVLAAALTPLAPAHAICVRYEPPGPVIQVCVPPFEGP